MSRTPPKPLLAVLAALLITPQAAADSYRCGRKLIRTGDRAADVLSICGEPKARDRGAEPIPGAGPGRVQVERWYYQRSGRSLQRVVLIHQGRVVAIRSGRR